MIEIGVVIGIAIVAISAAIVMIRQRDRRDQLSGMVAYMLANRSL